MCTIRVLCWIAECVANTWMCLHQQSFGRIVCATRTFLTCNIARWYTFGLAIDTRSFGLSTSPTLAAEPLHKATGESPIWRAMSNGSHRVTQRRRVQYAEKYLEICNVTVEQSIVFSIVVFRTCTYAYTHQICLAWFWAFVLACSLTRFT